jgi:hypothetical protein
VATKVDPVEGLEERARFTLGHRIASAKRATHADEFMEWIGDDRHGEI